jgi:hypothetical protein
MISTRLAEMNRIGRRTIMCMLLIRGAGDHLEFARTLSVTDLLVICAVHAWDSLLF